MATQRKGGKSAGGSGGSTLSVVVPAYNETDNIRPLCERLFKALKASSIDGELLIMDDESVGTAPTKAVVAELKTEGYNIRIHARTKKEGKGLSSAVLLGFDMAANDTMLCMDADLQHEPESVPDVAAPILNGTADFTVGSRNVDGGLSAASINAPAPVTVASANCLASSAGNPAVTPAAVIASAIKNT